MKNYLLVAVFLICSFGVGKSQNNDPIILPFPPLDAKISNNKLNVEWTVPTEENTSHYDIEISKDGKIFTKIGTVLSKAEQGNSKSPIDYTFTRSATGLSTAAILFLLPLLAFSLNNTKPNRTRYLPATIFLSAVTLFGCQKSEVDKADKTEIMYLRVAQVDNANHALYSKIVKVQ